MFSCERIKHKWGLQKRTVWGGGVVQKITKKCNRKTRGKKIIRGCGDTGSSLVWIQGNEQLCLLF